MRRFTVVTAVAFVVLVFGASSAPASHVSCGQTITADTTLDADLDCTFAAPLKIGAAAITLDLGGYSVRGAIENTGFDDVRIVNGTIDADFRPEITLAGARANTIRDIRVTNRRGVIEINDSSDTVLTRVSGAGPGAGGTEVWLYESPRATFSGGAWLNVSAGNENRFMGLRDSSIEAYSDNVIRAVEGTSITLRGNRNTVTAGKRLKLVFVYKGESNAVIGNSFLTDDVAVSVLQSRSTVIERNTISSEGVPRQVAMYLGGNASTSVADNEISGPAFSEGETSRPAGILLDLSNAEVLVRNRISGRGDGIQLSFANENVVSHNRIGKVLGSGIYAYHSDANRIFRNNVSRAGRHGIELTSFSDDNQVERNKAARNTLDGIAVLAGRGTRNLLSSNEARLNGDDGIGVDQAGNTVQRNVAVKNFDWGIEAVAGTIDAGGNLARSNGQAAQCLNVACRSRGGQR